MSASQRRAAGAVLAVLALLAVVLWGSGGGEPSAPTQPASSSAVQRQDPSGLPVVLVEDLPVQARRTLDLIDAGGPFPYARDGVVFQNRERLLPAQSRDAYHEYTVPTPGESDRGARRIITGPGGQRYYSDDHYGSFRVVRAQP